MKQFRCQCGSVVFFHSEVCLNCGAQLAFDPETMDMVTLNPHGEQLVTAGGKTVQRCDNSIRYGVCNWLAEDLQPGSLCFACRFNRTVPNQSIAGNQQRWHRLEEGKKRLFYTLMQLALPLENGWDYPDSGLLLDFIEDERSDALYAETFVHTGYLGGVITINTLEADDAERELQRLQMNESYRTVLGHLRHESGHYYWQRVDADADLRVGFTEVFGDEAEDYSAALARYYADGPVAKWWEHYISAYASAHPTEDWAESWGHYLHIYDALDTAAAHQLIAQGPETMSIDTRISCWRELSVKLNELNRSVGRRDAYPFVLNKEVERKLTFVDTVIRRLQTARPRTANR